MTVTERPAPAEAGLDNHHMLALLPGMKPDHWQAILDQLDDPVQLLQLSPTSLKALSVPAAARRAIADWQCGRLDAQSQDRLEHVRQQCWSHGIQVVHWCHPDYPESLRHIHGPPPVLYLRGNREVLRTPCLAMVGSRHASRDGLNHAAGFARALAEQGIAVVSGLALGVDGAAHRGALSADGVTHAVVATGPDRVYPARHRRLHADIAGRGAVVTEMPPGVAPAAALFPRRNRIISGLSLGIVVAQAGRRSGALITARQAAEQGREVFAVPGSIHDPMARGCHTLLREGAKLIESVDDILEELPGVDSQGPAQAPTEPATPDADPDEARVLAALGHDPLPLDTLQQRSGLTPDRLSAILLTMELKGLLTAIPGGRYQRRKPEG